MTRLATVKEACAYAKVSQTKLYGMINAGEVTAYKLDRRTVVDLDSIDAMHTRRLVPWKPSGPLNPRITGPPKAAARTGGAALGSDETQRRK